MTKNSKPLYVDLSANRVGIGTMAEWEKRLRDFFKTNDQLKLVGENWIEGMITIMKNELSRREREVREKLESMKPEKNFHANHEIDNHCFQCMEIVKVHPEYTRGFSDALDQAIEAVKGTKGDSKNA